MKTHSKSLPTLTARNIIRLWLGTWGLYALLYIIPWFDSYHTGSTAMLIGAVSQTVFWAGSLLTLIVLALYYRGKGTDSKFNPRWLIYICVAAWAAYLLLIGAVGRFVPMLLAGSFMNIASTTFFVAGLTTLPAIVVAFLGLGKQTREQEAQRAANSTALRVLAALIVLALAIGTYAAIRTGWTSVEDGKFVYNNTANGFGCAALALIVALSYLQRDVYWLNRGRTVKLDERQIQERQQVFETSYKLGTALVFVAFCIVFTHKQSLLTMVQHDSFTPGNILWPFANIVMALFALPLLVAAYRKRKA